MMSRGILRRCHCCEFGFNKLSLPAFKHAECILVGNVNHAPGQLQYSVTGYAVSRQSNQHGSLRLE